jgi:hydrogenase maturation protein HypF
MGRLFDAVAAWCGLCDKVSYEGEAALLLEVSARQFIRSKPGNYFYTYPIQFKGALIDTQSLIGCVADDIKRYVHGCEVAARFHCTLVQMIRVVARRHNVNAVAFSGGVFQNAVLVSLIERHLCDEFQLYFHRQLSPNDECISFGQLAHWCMENGDRKGELEQKDDFVVHVR